MAGKKVLYAHFEKNNYVIAKSELLKLQMEVLYLKKMLKNLAILRSNKEHYRKILEEKMSLFIHPVQKLDDLMPEDEEIAKIKVRKEKKFVRKEKKEEPKKIVKEKPKVVVDEIEEELMKIREKLNSLNNS
jgi:hypothetical protein